VTAIRWGADSGRVARPLVRNEIARPTPFTGSVPGPGTQAGIINTRWFGGAPATGTYAIVETPTTIGARFVRKTWTAVNAVTVDTGFDLRVAAGPATVTQALPVSPGQVLTGYAMMRASASGKVAEFGFSFVDALGGSIASNSRLRGAGVALTANTWTDVAGTVTVPAGAVYAWPLADISATSTTAWAVNDTLDCAGVALYRGAPTTLFRSGSRAGWRWLGTPGDSVSVGPV
jgi:hypothetical protein